MHTAMPMAWQPRSRHKRSRSGERGAALIEFAFAFPLLFLLVYSLLAYGILFTLQQSMTLAAEEGARAAIAVDPDYPDYALQVQTRARTTAMNRLAWLPETYRDVLSANIVVVIDAGNVATLRVRYPDYAGNPIIPAITLPGLGSVPPYPADLRAEASIQL
ncbi:TadE/TadG family type IV pilus assembly protein [Thioalbus denitrificans]|uniref:TadE-like protein n=1 Tax=Thioalbus denitrificans TaxID=547122 RepID=A0A369CAJ7_9GAMM|nr:TadE/TadG family type IV pilus assembly protein [Thioalbus denitrificans]RCX29776.1 TadE-like protein [Thioalbus denitrificans]